jgi:cell division protein FtsB
MKRPGFSWRYTLVIVGLVVLAYLVMDFNSRMGALRRLSAQKEVVAAQLEGQKATEAFINTQIAYASSDEAAMKWAYEEGSMVRSGDVPVVPVPPAEITPVATPAPVVATIQAANWEYWLRLFVDVGKSP